MDRNVDLTEGNIFIALTKLALPIIGTAFIQMAYNLTDIAWLGRLSTDAVAAAGTAGFFMWFGSGLAMISQVGVAVGVSQSYGKDDLKGAMDYVSNGIRLDIIIAIVYSLFLLIFRHNMVGFFKLGDKTVYKMTVEYLIVISIGMIFHFINPVLSAVLNSSGNSITPFKINTIGLVFNMILDPLLIFGIGPVKGFGIKGAAAATVLSQLIVSIIFIAWGKSNNALYSNINLFKKLDRHITEKIVKLGFPAFLQISAHSGINMVLTRLIAQFGSVPLAVQSVGSKIESISWMTADGFQAAIAAFVGQNLGAKKDDRIREGYRKGMGLVGGIGILATLLLILGGRSLFSIFVPDDPMAIEEGVRYLTILGFSQIFSTVEIGTAGAFNGLGRTLPPAITGVIFNVLRIPLAILLANYTSLALSGIWWSISISTIAKGIVLPLLFIRLMKKGFHMETV